MNEMSVDLAGVYRTMDALSLQHVPHLGVPTEVRVFGAEISAEVACLNDEAVVSFALQLDADAQERGNKDEPLGTAFARHHSHPPAAYAGDSVKTEAWALQQLRISVVSRRFKAEYAQRFPERAFVGYEQGEDFLQGSVVAFRTMGQFLATPYQTSFY